MKLVQELDRIRMKNGKPQRRALFECPVCLERVNRGYHWGLRAKTCGEHGRDNHGVRNPRYRHGYATGRKRLYTIWASMIRRCYNKNDKSYQRWYGSKGITVCEEWHDFVPFKEWALSNGYRADLVIDRIDSSKGYTPENCRWTTRTENSRARAGVKITMAIARLIRQASKAGFHRKEIARTFGVSWALVSFVLKNKTWRE